MIMSYHNQFSDLRYQLMVTQHSGKIMLIPNNGVTIRLLFTSEIGSIGKKKLYK